MTRYRLFLVPLLLTVAGCSLLRGDPVPPPPPPAPEVALARGQDPEYVKRLIERDEQGNATAYEPLTLAREAVNAAAQSPAVARTSGQSLDRARKALARAEKSWTAIKADPLAHSQALASLTHDSHMAMRWGQIAQAEAGSDTALNKLADVQKTLQRQDRADARWLGAQLVPGDFGALHFAVGTADLSAGSRPVIGKLADFLGEHPRYHLTVAGYTDNTPPSDANLAHFLAEHPDLSSPDEPRSQQAADYNLWMSRRRAQAVKQALTARGIDAARVEVQAYGQSRPIASNETAAGRRKNRRVVVTVSQAGDQ